MKRRSVLSALLGWPWLPFAGRSAPKNVCEFTTERNGRITTYTIKVPVKYNGRVDLDFMSGFIVIDDPGVFFLQIGVYEPLPIGWSESTLREQAAAGTRRLVEHEP